MDERVRSVSARLLERRRAAGAADLLRGGLYPVGLSLFLFPPICILLGAAGFLLGIPLSKWHALAALVPVCLALYLSCARKAGKALACLGIFLLANAILLGLHSLPFYDEGDGVAYHRPAAILMADGWNPVRDAEGTRALDGGIRPLDPNDGYVREAVWWFPKAQWIFSAQVYLLTGNLDAGSFANGLYAALSFGIAFWALSALFRLSAFERLFAAFVIAANPVVAAQAASGMIDTLMASLLTILLLSLAGYAKTRDARFLPFVAGAIPMVGNLKTTGAVYAAIALLLFVVPMAWKSWRNGERRDRRMLAAIGASMLASLVVGVNPYLTNLANHANPLHPFSPLGGGDPIRSKYIDAPGSVFHGTDVLQRFFVSHLVAQPGTICGERVGPIGILPARSLLDGYDASLVGAELCGFGPMFSIAFGAALVLLFFVGDRHAWWILAVVAASTLAQPHSYIARYVPQLWLVPPVVLCAIRSQSAESGDRGIRSALLFFGLLGLLAAGSALVIGGQLRRVQERTGNDVNALRLIERNPRIAIGRDSRQIGTWFCQERVARDCLDEVRFSGKDPFRQPHGPVVARLRHAPVVLETDRENARRDLANMVRPPAGGLFAEIADLRFRQLKRAWGGKDARAKPGKG